MKLLTFSLSSISTGCKNCFWLSFRLMKFQNALRMILQTVFSNNSNFSRFRKYFSFIFEINCLRTKTRSCTALSGLCKYDILESHIRRPRHHSIRTLAISSLIATSSLISVSKIMPHRHGHRSIFRWSHVEDPIGEESSLEGRQCGRNIVVGDGYHLIVEPCHITFEIVHAPRESLKSYVTQFMQSHVMQLCEILNPSSGQIGKPLESQPHEAGPEPFCTCTPLSIDTAWMSPSFFACSVPCGRRDPRSVIKPHGWETKFHRYLHDVDLFAKKRVIERVSGYLLGGWQHSRDSFQDRLEFYQSLLKILLNLPRRVCLVPLRHSFDSPIVFSSVSRVSFIGPFLSSQSEGSWHRAPRVNFLRLEHGLTDPEGFSWHRRNTVLDWGRKCSVKSLAHCCGCTMSWLDGIRCCDSKRATSWDKMYNLSRRWLFSSTCLSSSMCIPRWQWWVSLLRPTRRKSGAIPRIVGSFVGSLIYLIFCRFLICF